ncbi:hypothetical protein JCM9279_006285 [Rhodotorula babjevae]
MSAPPARSLVPMRRRRVDSDTLDDVSTTLSNLTLGRAESPSEEEGDPVPPRDAPVSTSAYSMAANLLDDVLVLIFEELGRPAHTPEAYRDRQDALHNVCLASRRLLRLARPYLWRQVAVRSRAQLTLLKSAEAAAALGVRTRLYTVVGSGHVGSGRVDLAEGVGAASLLRNVVEMRLTSAPLVTFRLASLEPFTRLRRLHLGLAHLPRNTSATLPALEELCIRQVWSAPEDVQEQLQSARLPRLRELFFVQVQDLGPSAPHQLDQVLTPDLLPQLDLIQTDWTSIDPSSDLAQGLDPPVLVMGPPRAGPPRPLSRHSISQSARFEDATKATDTLTRLDASIRLLPPRPSHDPPYLLFLPTSLRTLAAAEPTIAPQLQALEAPCARSRVRIEWTDELPEGELVSLEFRSVALVMSARLIDDVLVLIFDELALPAHTRDSYCDRQETLRNVCLASRRLRRLAQPRLWQQVAIRSREQFELLESAASGVLGRHTKLLTIVGSATLEVDEAIAGLSSLLPEVQEIRLASSPMLLVLDFALLGHYTNLRRLHVEKAKLLEGRCATLSALEVLCLYQAYTSSSWVQLQLQGAHLPRLRELYFIELPGMSTITLDEIVPPDVLHQLDVLQVDERAVNADGELVQGDFPPVLVFHPEFSLPQPLPRHTVCHPFLFRYHLAAIDTFCYLIKRLQLTPPAPSSTSPRRLLILPPKLRHFLDTRPRVAHHLRILDKLCAEKNVRILWDDEQVDGELISPAFRRIRLLLCSSSVIVRPLVDPPPSSSTRILLVMSDRLNDDVLVTILDELARPVHTLGAYLGRQVTLHNVCLASRRLCRLAQPKLWRQVIIRSREQFKLLAATATDMRRLHISLANIGSAQPVTLPNLEHLTIERVELSTHFAQQQLRPARLPRLRELQFSKVLFRGQIQLADILAPELLPQLELVQTAWTFIDSSSDLAQGLHPPVLVFGGPATGAARAPPRHYIFEPEAFRAASAASFTLTTIDASIRLCRPRPSHDPPFLLLLPVALRTLAAAGPAVARQLRGLEALCAEKRVRLEWYKGPPEGELVSPEFRRFARELREARALKR